MKSDYEYSKGFNSNLLTATVSTVYLVFMSPMSSSGQMAPAVQAIRRHDSSYVSKFSAFIIAMCIVGVPYKTVHLSLAAASILALPLKAAAGITIVDP